MMEEQARLSKYKGGMSLEEAQDYIWTAATPVSDLDLGS
jgi:hypothetical protein